MLTAILVVLFTFLTGATQEEIRFAGVPWNASAKVIKTAMADIGLEFVEKDKDGDLVFEGTISGEPARLFAILTKGEKLVKWQIIIGPPDHRTLPYYRQLKSEMIEQYGSPKIDIEEWKYPYNDGDHVGHEETAIKNGKGTLAASWSRGESMYPGVVVQITDRLTVNVDYEGVGWSEELARRKKRIW